MTTAQPVTRTDDTVAQLRARWPSLPGPRWLWPMLATLSAVVLIVNWLIRHASSWHYFHLGVDLLVRNGPDGSAQGLHLYRDHPELQFGPLSIVASAPFTLFGETAGGVVATIVLSALGLVTFAFLLDAVDRLAPGLLGLQPRWVVPAAGTVFVITWGDLAVRTAHIDDGIVWASMAIALSCCARRQGLGVAWAVAIAAAAKPWAIMFAPLVFVVPGRWRARGFLLVCGFVALTWAPFVLVEPETLSASEFELAIDPTSGLNLLGVDTEAVPAWVRPVQILGGMALVAAVVAMRRWPAAVLVAVAWRLMLDPGARRYYVVGFVFGALIMELLARRGRVPWFTIVAAATLLVTAAPELPSLPGSTVRVACVAVGLGVGLCARLGGRSLRWRTTGERRH